MIALNFGRRLVTLCVVRLITNCNEVVSDVRITFNELILEKCIFLIPFIKKVKHDKIVLS